MKQEVFDVIVIGSGFAGLKAAIIAKEQGASVVLLEKMKTLGGNSVISDGGIAAAGTSFQRKLGIDDDAKLMKADILKSGGPLSDEALVDVLCDQALDVFNWTKEVLKVPYRKDVELFGGHTKPRSHSPEGPPSGRPFIKRLEALAKKLGVEIRTQHYVKAFLKKENTLEGVLCDSHYRFKQPFSDQESIIMAQKGVVLATGGFSADVDFRKQFDQRLDQSIDSTNKPSASAEVMRLAIEMEAQLVGMHHIQLAPWTSPEEKGFGDGPLFADYIALPKGVLINAKTGLRFVNELSDRGILADAILKEADPIVILTDQKALDESPRDIKRALQKQVVRKYETLEALAKGENIKEKPFLDTINRFNTFVKNQKDDDFNKPLEAHKPIESAPFYAMRIQVKTHHTMGGLKIDSLARVLNKENQVIDKLYAAGEITGGIHGKSRLGSMAITDCFVFGAVAGKSAALGR